MALKALRQLTKFALNVCNSHQFPGPHTLCTKKIKKGGGREEEGRSLKSVG